MFHRRNVLLICLVGLLLGCNKSGLETYPVTGIITYQDQPVAGAHVGFIPQGEDPEMKPANGSSDEEGHYTLSVYISPGNQPQGAMPGTYNVTVQKYEGPELDEGVEYSESIQNPALRPKNILPPIYANAKTTPLSAEVTTGDNELSFTLDE